MPAGRVLGVIAIALAVAALFNSEALVRAGEGMQPGTTRDIVLSVGRPIDDVAGAIGLHLPREGLDLAFGQEDKTASGTELEEGSTAILRRNRRKAERQSFAQPTPEDPLHVLVTGDSQAEFLGQRLIDQSPPGLLEVETVARNGTGLTNPAFFNWEINAEQEVATREPDAVVMAIGGNDGFNVQTPDGSLYDPGEPGWETEFARRVAVVSSVFSSDGRRPVYWVPPPTARDPSSTRSSPPEPGREARHRVRADAALRGRLLHAQRRPLQRRRSRSTAGACSRASRTASTSRARAPSRPARLILDSMAEDFPALRGR